MSPALFPTNPTRFDPYKNFKFRLKFDGVEVAGMTDVSGLAPKPPTRTKFEVITLERGVTHDTAFLTWANGSAAGPRKDIVIERFDEAGRLAASYMVVNCRVSAFQGAPDLDADANAVKIQLMKLEHAGLRRDP